MATERQLVISGMAIMIIATVHLLYPRVEKAASAYRHLWIPFKGGTGNAKFFSPLQACFSSDLPPGDGSTMSASKRDATAL